MLFNLSSWSIQLRPRVAVRSACERRQNTMFSEEEATNSKTMPVLLRQLGAMFAADSSGDARRRE